jgi:hypothetical protein
MVLSCSRSMAFVLTSLPYLTAKGEIFALLPDATLSSSKDSTAWTYLAKSFSIRTVASFGRRTFKGCSASAAIIALERSHLLGLPRPIHHSCLPQTTIRIEIIRGVVPMHEATNGRAGGEFEFLHTTDVRGEIVGLSERRIRDLRRFALGPGVLLPRIGEPSPSKCALYLRTDRIVLSDCLYCLQCSTEADARFLRERLLDFWAEVAAAYGGTCARYLTVKNLKTLLETLGFTVVAHCRQR